MIPSSTGNYSSWATLAAGKTVQMEAQEKKDKQAQAYANSWGSETNTAKLVKNLEASKAQSVVQPTLRIGSQGAQAPKKDAWDKVAKRFVTNVESRAYEANPHHNGAYKKAGQKAEGSKKKAQDGVISKVKGVKMGMAEFGQLQSQLGKVEEEFANPINCKNAHDIPVLEIFKQLSSLKLVKTKFGDNYSFLIPCRLKVLNSTNSEQSGILEVTLAKTGKICHNFFRECYKDTYVTTKYKNNGAMLNQLRKELDSDDSETLEISTSKAKVVLLKV